MQEKNNDHNLKPFVSIILPCYNEEAILQTSVNNIIKYLESKSHKYRWEILIIDDGSKDKTGEMADEFNSQYDNIRVIHHPVNLNLGRALQTGFRHAKGDIFIVLDIDLSYSIEYIEQMADKLSETYSDIVIASPYMKGGQVIAVPFLRKIMSLWVNKFMRLAAQDKYHTYTGMVRAYRKSFIQTLNLKTKDYEINPEILYKAMILRARIVEIPAHLDWTEQNKYKGKRTSSIRILRGFFSGIMSAFIFRPYIFFLALGTLLMILSMYELIWLLYDTLSTLSQSHGLGSTFSSSLALQFKKNPQSFMVGGITFIAAIQVLSLGFLSLQSKRYFEELFHLGTSFKKI
ncbi:glycosyltransferase family 2 protein [Ginsengibacter hankyongi]|uniref:Glycosyltransferase family 2 protein n=1 Tax=Ginsengibacter hankyongi TaxID=2607284 RepID=A0A5J5IIA5_9BACT|nr:glycosyltransferase family 2 protein [Ginsengibacter hankyongi]KAA9039308.1 glycosyltransferase family 2 protein [Ginsengibacter hankyongi]